MGLYGQEWWYRADATTLVLRYFDRSAYLEVWSGNTQVQISRPQFTGLWDTADTSTTFGFTLMQSAKYTELQNNSAEAYTQFTTAISNYANKAEAFAKALGQFEPTLLDD